MTVEPATPAVKPDKSKWLYAFEDLCRHTYSGYTSEGMWCNAHMFYGMGLSVEDAVKQFGEQGIKMVRIGGASIANSDFFLLHSRTIRSGSTNFGSASIENIFLHSFCDNSNHSPLMCLEISRLWIGVS